MVKDPSPYSMEESRFRGDIIDAFNLGEVWRERSQRASSGKQPDPEQQTMLECCGKSVPGKM